MTEVSKDGSEGIVDRAAAALRDQAVPAGPPAEVLGRVLAAGEADGGPGRRHRSGGWRPVRWLQAAAAVLVIGAIAGVLILVTAGSGGAAWADVQARIRNARTVRFKLTLHSEGAPDMVMTCMFLGPGRLRQEMLTPQKVVSIMDVTRGEILLLEPDIKRACPAKISGLPAAQIPQDRLSHIRRLIENAETELGRKQIAGRDAKGYRVGKGDEQLTIWADAKTGVPIRMEWKILAGSTQNILTDFQFDRPMDEKLFSLDVPAGYTKVKPLDLTDPKLADVAVLLEVWAKVRGGTFPDTLSGPQYAKEVGDIEKDWSAEKLHKVGSAIGRAFVYLATHRHVQYVGKGVKQGEVERPVLLVPPAGEGGKYRVLFGDLKIRELAKDQLPKSPAASQ